MNYISYMKEFNSLYVRVKWNKFQQVSDCELRDTPFTRYNRLSNRYNRLYRVNGD